MTAYFASRAGKIAGAERSRKFPLWRSYGDNPLSSNEIEQMASYRSYSATGPYTDESRVTSTQGSPDGLACPKLHDRLSPLLPYMS